MKNCTLMYLVSLGIFLAVLKDCVTFERLQSVSKCRNDEMKKCKLLVVNQNKNSKTEALKDSEKNCWCGTKQCVRTCCGIFKGEVKLDDKCTHSCTEYKSPNESNIFPNSFEILQTKRRICGCIMCVNFTKLMGN